MSARRHGFTLVELLVVMVIIGVLVGLLLPAVRSAVEKARQATCMNNMKELGTAIQSYEVDKGHLPGFINQPVVSGGMTVTWAMAIMDKLGRADLVNRALNNKGQWDNVQINQLVCPDDPYKGTQSPTNGYYYMSYVVPYLSGVQSPAPTIYFVDRTQSPPPAVQISQITSPSRTVMLGERTLVPGDTGFVAHAPAWTDVTSTYTDANYSSGTYKQLTFNWPTSVVPLTPLIFGSKHPGLVMVWFFDGHGEAVRDDNATNVNPDGVTPAPGLLIPQ
jgi:prepilin-type N-terminal cleavage/methylation domain-containing protein/prepilin-type processing-associated H-X9-DG protein